MNSDKNINSIQYCSIIILILVASFFGISLYTCINYAGVNSWISLLTSVIIGLFIVLIFNYINDFEPNKTLSNKINILYGNKIGFFVNLIIIICFFSILLNSLCNVLIYIISQFLTQTPLTFIGIAFILMTTYINTKGIEVISRVSYIFLIIDFTLFLISVLGLYNNIDYSNLLPILENGFNPIFKSVFYIVIDNIIPIFIMLTIPKNRIIKNYKLNKYVYYSFIFSFMIMLIVCITTIGTLGIDLAKLYKYPEYIVLKNISLFGFLNNMENILNIQWILGLFIIITMSIYAIKSNFNNEKIKNLFGFIPSIIALLLIKKIFINDSLFESYIHNVTPYIKLTLLALMIITFVMIFIKKRTTYQDKNS